MKWYMKLPLLQQKALVLIMRFDMKPDSNRTFMNANGNKADKNFMIKSIKCHFLGISSAVPFSETNSTHLLIKFGSLRYKMHETHVIW